MWNLIAVCVVACSDTVPYVSLVQTTGDLLCTLLFLHPPRSIDTPMNIVGFRCRRFVGLIDEAGNWPVSQDKVQVRERLRTVCVIITLIILIFFIIYYGFNV